MRDYEIYTSTVYALQQYFGRDAVKELFLHGGCYFFASYLHSHMKNSFIMFNKEEEHCAIEFQNEIYDITGKIGRKNYRIATGRQIDYMKKKYIPAFSEKELLSYLEKSIWNDDYAV